MVIKRTAIWLMAASVLLLLATRAMAQPAHSNLNYQTPQPTYENGSAKFADDNPGQNHSLSPFKPVGFEPQFDWFAPAETSGYGRGPRPHIGYFGSYDRLMWSMSAPELAFVGSSLPDPSGVNSFFPNGPSVDNHWIGATVGWGNRWEVGYTDTDDYGWLFSVLDHVSQGQYRIDQNPAFYLGDPAGALSGTTLALEPFLTPTVVGIPYLFSEFRMQNLNVLNGLEITRFYRARKLHKGGYFELLYGARWFQMNDAFIVQGEGNGGSVENNIHIGAGGITAFQSSANILDSSIWANRVINNLIGPQIGMRFFRQRGRWVTSVEARFLAAANFQNYHLKAFLGSNAISNAGLNTNLLTNWRGLGIDTQMNTTTFAPLGELRVNVSWQATRSVGLRVGYTGLVAGGMARGSNTVDYNAVNLLGIRNDNENQLFFVNGLNVGFEVNR